MNGSCNAFRAALLCLPTLLPAAARAEGIDTEHLFAFMIGTDVGEAGEREFQSQTAGQFGKNGGSYRAVNQQIEFEFVPADNFRIELAGAFASHHISGVPGLDDRRQWAWQGASLDLRYRFLGRETAPFGLTFAMETHADRIDEISAVPVRAYGTDITLAVDRELVPNLVVGALNLLYQPEWTRFVGSGAAQQDAAIGVATAVMAQVGPGVLLGAEARYMRKYDGIGLDELAGQAFFVGPTAYFKLSDRSRLTAAWSFQAWGRSAGSSAALDLVNFERHQARLIFGVNF